MQYKLKVNICCAHEQIKLVKENLRKETCSLYTRATRDVRDPDTSIRYGYLPDNISVFGIGETGVKTLERELKSCLIGLTSRAFIWRLPDLFQFYLNQWKHMHVLFKFKL